MLVNSFSFEFVNFDRQPRQPHLHEIWCVSSQLGFLVDYDLSDRRYSVLGRSGAFIFPGIGLGDHGEKEFQNLNELAVDDQLSLPFLCKV